MKRAMILLMTVAAVSSTAVTANAYDLKNEYIYTLENNETDLMLFAGVKDVVHRIMEKVQKASKDAAEKSENADSKERDGQENDTFEIQFENDMMKKETLTTGTVTLVGEDEWNLTFTTDVPGFYSDTEFTIGGFWFTEEDGTYDVECTDDGGLTGWSDRLWEQVQPALSQGLQEYFEK